MGILDDIKNQAEALKAKEEAEQQRQAELLEYYQQNLNPKMQQIYSFLNELTTHLNYIKQHTPVEYPVKPGHTPHTFLQQDYKVTIDSAKDIREINLRFDCVLEEPLVIEVEGADRVRNYTELLHSYRIEFNRTDEKDSKYELIGAKFRVPGPIPVNVIFQGDVENSAINLILRNVEKPGVVKHSFKDRHITEEFLDGLGKYILRQNPEFFKLDIDEQQKEEIRRKIQEDMQRRQQELEEAERLLKEEEEKEAEKKSWKNLFKKTD